MPPELPPRPSLFLQAVGKLIAGGAVVFERQEFAAHADRHAIAFRIGPAGDLHVEVDGRHDAVAEFLLDQRLERGTVHHDELVEAVNERIGWRHRRRSAAHWHLVEQGLLAGREAEQLCRVRRLRLGELVLAEDRSRHQDRRHAADLLAYVFPAPALLALDVEKLLSQSGTRHDGYSGKSLTAPAPFSARRSAMRHGW